MEGLFSLLSCGTFRFVNSTAQLSPCALPSRPSHSLLPLASPTLLPQGRGSLSSPAPASLPQPPRTRLTCGGTAPHSGQPGRAARSARRGSRAGTHTGRRRRCSGRARTRKAPGTRGPTSLAGKCSGRTPARTASHCRSSGSCSGGPTSPPRIGRCRWPDRSVPPRGCTGMGGGM